MAQKAAFIASHLGLDPSLVEQLKRDERGWPGTISREALALVSELGAGSSGRAVPHDPARLAGDYVVLSCDPLTVALEYNEANVVRGGSLVRVSEERIALEPRDLSL